jgi:hypothetical protein
MADSARLWKVMDRVEGLYAEEQELKTRTGVTLHACSRRRNMWRQSVWFAKSAVGLTITDQGTVDEEGHWCGTAGCFAGWAVTMFAPPGTRIVEECTVKLPDGTRRPVPTYAAALLDLCGDDDGRLFDPRNTLPTLRKYITEIVGPRP